MSRFPLFSIAVLSCIVLFLSCSDDSNPSGFKDNTVIIGVAGELTNTDNIGHIVCIISGDNISGSVESEMDFDPVNKMYSGAVRRPVSGSDWKLTVKVFDPEGHMSGQYSRSITAYSTVITMSKFSAKNALPQINITAPYSCRIGDTVSITGTVTDSFGGTVTIYEDIGNKGTFKKVSKIDAKLVAPLKSTNLYYTVKVVDNDGNTVIQEVTISVIQDLPQPSADAAPMTLTRGDSLLLLGTASSRYGKIVKWEWAPGDTASFIDVSPDSTLLIPKVHYTEDFIAVLRVTDDVGNTATDTITIRVVVDKPVARLSSDNNRVGLGKDFTIRCTSTDRYGYITKRELDIGNKGIFIRYSGEDTTLQAPATPGTFKIVQRVTDDDNESSLCTLSLSVIGPPEAPTLRSPIDGSFDHETDSSIILTWNDVALADKYTVVLSEDSTFKTTYRTKTVETNTLSTNLGRTMTFYWRVKALDTILDQESVWSEIWRFSTENDFWSSVTRVPYQYSVRNHATECVDGKIYVIGGLIKVQEGHNSTRRAVDTVWMYDIETNQWSQKASMPATRYDMGSCVYDGKIYLFGGSENGFTDSVRMYDPLSDTWTPKSPMKTKRANMGVGVIRDKIYVIGGWNNNRLSSVEEYDPLTDTWTTKADFPFLISGMTSAVLNDTLYIIGGYREALNQSFNTGSSIYRYDQTGDQWIGKTSTEWMSTASSGKAIALNDNIYLVGGFRGEMLFEYDPARDFLKRECNLLSNRSLFGITSWDGKIYIVGGSFTFQTGEYSPTYTDDTNLVESYTP